MLTLFSPLTLLAIVSAGLIAFEPLTFVSTHDQTRQPAHFYPSPETGPRPMLVVLHWWSTDSERYNPDDWVVAARARGWHVLLPNFRGANTNPESCGSPAARQDVLDAIAAAKARAEVDAERVYVAGVSGGGHMAMLMAAYHPGAFAAVSSWAGISDLAAWHAETRAAGHGYWQDLEASTGGAPGSSEGVDRQYQSRSPLPHLANAAGVPLDLNTGLHDGHTGSVPIHHTLDAFNVVAAARGLPGVAQSQINALSQEWVPANAPVQDPDYERRIYLRQQAGLARVTIFDGGHEGLPASACAWLATQRRTGE